MTPKSNLHTHTQFCDGKSTMEDIVCRAIELGYESIGFSAHAYTPLAPDGNMTPEGEREYRAEAKRLGEKYAKQITVYTGLELDVISEKPEYKYDYIIGSVHYIPCGGEYIACDDTAEIARNLVEKQFGGDWYRYAEEYYAIAEKIPELTGCDIIGHFDLLTKFNEGGRFFSEESTRYRAAASAAVQRAVKSCPVFEINTGVIYRIGRKTPYPAPFILKEINRCGGEVILSSDSHDAASLGFAFEEAAELAAACGFRYLKILRAGSLKSVKL